MKKILLACLIGIAYIAVGQDLISNSGIALKAGFYKNYEELKSNSPSIPFDYPIGMKKACLDEEEVCVYRYRIRIERQKAAEIGEVFGFSDGENVYIRTGNKGVLTPHDRYSKMDRVGKYGLYSTKLNASKGKKAYPADLTTFVVDLTSGETKQLIESQVQKIIADNAELLAEFINTKRKKRSPYGEYIRRYFFN